MMYLVDGEDEGELGDELLAPHHHLGARLDQLFAHLEVRAALVAQAQLVLL